MSVYFEGNAFVDGGQIQNVVVTSTTIGNCNISTSTLDMNMKNITSVKDPVNPQDAATKQYVDNLEVIISYVSLSGTNNVTISNNTKGSYVITISSVVLNGPSAVFHVSKSESSRQAHIVRTAAAPGYLTNVFLSVTWPPNSGILLKKSGGNYDGAYKVKVM